MSKSTSFRPVGGSFYAHLFENRRTGTPLGLYWNFEVEFEPLVDGDGDEWPCNALIEWLSWPVRSWRQLDGCSLATATLVVEPEISVYAYSQHQPVAGAQFELSVLDAARVHIQGRLSLDLEDLEGEITSGCEIPFAANLDFGGLIVMPDNLDRRTKDAAGASRALAQFIDLAEFDEPVFDERRWVFPLRSAAA